MPDLEYQDIIIKKPVSIKILRDKEISKLLDEPNYFALIKILRNGPMTVKELENAYKTETGKTKSDKTIYRYLKVLEKINIVVPVGQRVVIGKKVNETLYGRTALLFHDRMEYENGENWWKTEKGKIKAEKISKLVGRVVNKEVSLESFQNFLHDLYLIRDSILEELIESDMKSEFFLDGGYWEIVKLTDSVSMLAALLKRPDI
ncbi:MAG: hypothetical protein ACFFCQ_01475, partial [Promethearchaeota archaeon]